MALITLGGSDVQRTFLFPLSLFLLPGKNVPNSNLESPLLENSVLLGSDFLLY